MDSQILTEALKHEHIETPAQGAKKSRITRADRAGNSDPQSHPQLNSSGMHVLGRGGISEEAKRAVNQEYVATEEATIEKLKTGEYRIRMTAPGYKDSLIMPENIRIDGLRIQFRRRIPGADARAKDSNTLFVMGKASPPTHLLPQWRRPTPPRLVRHLELPSPGGEQGANPAEERRT